LLETYVTFTCTLHLQHISVTLEETLDLLIARILFLDSSSKIQEYAHWSRLDKCLAISTHLQVVRGAVSSPTRLCRSKSCVFCTVIFCFVLF